MNRPLSLDIRTQPPHRKVLTDETRYAFRLVPLAKPDDGLLEWCRADELSAAGVIVLLPRVLRGTHSGHKRVAMGCFERFAGEFVPPAPVHADGEILSEGASRVEVEVLPAALRVMGFQPDSG